MLTSFSKIILHYTYIHQNSKINKKKKQPAKHINTIENVHSIKKEKQFCNV